MGTLDFYPWKLGLQKHFRSRGNVQKIQAWGVGGGHPHLRPTIGAQACTPRGQSSFSRVIPRTPPGTSAASQSQTQKQLLLLRGWGWDGGSGPKWVAAPGQERWSNDSLRGAVLQSPACISTCVWLRSCQRPLVDNGGLGNRS